MLGVRHGAVGYGVEWAQVAEELRARVRTELHFTCSCGVAANKTLAKVRAPAADSV